MSLLNNFEQFISQPDEIHTLQEIARNEWNTAFSPDEFKKNLQDCLEFAKNPSIDEEDEHFTALLTYFKRVRKAGTMLRSSFVMLDQRHDPPESFDTFVWALGQLKDYLQAKSFSNLETYISILQRLFEHSPDFFIPANIPSSPEFVISEAKIRLARVEEILAQEIITAPESHELRKKLRLLTNLYTLAKKQPPNQQTNMVAKVASQLIEINDELGDIQDDLVQRNIQGSIIYDTETVTLQSSLREQIVQLLLGES